MRARRLLTPTMGFAGEGGTQNTHSPVVVVTDRISGGLVANCRPQVINRKMHLFIFFFPAYQDATRVQHAFVVNHGS